MMRACLAGWCASSQLPDPALLEGDMTTIRNLMWHYVGLVRTGDRLQRAQRELRHLWHEIEEFYRTTQLNDQLVGLRNAVQVARMVSWAALRNRHSCGTHYRADDPVLAGEVTTMNEEIYLDHSATTPTDPRVVEAMQPYWGEIYGNASSLHGVGKAAEAAIQRATETVAEVLNCRAGGPPEIVFTSGGTEADNLALKGVALAMRARSRGNHIITTAAEHHAVLDVAQELASEGFDVTFLPVDAYGCVTPEQVVAAMRPDTVLVSVLYASNEIGSVNPISDIGGGHKARKSARALSYGRGSGAWLVAAGRAGAERRPDESLGAQVLRAEGHRRACDSARDRAKGADRGWRSTGASPQWD